MFNSKVSTSDTGIQPSQPAFGRAILPVGKSNLAHHRLSSMALSPPTTGPDPVRLPNNERTIPSIPPRPVCFPRPPPNPGLRLQPVDARKVKQVGERLQNLMQRQQMPPGTKPLLPGTNQPPSPALSHVAAPSPTSRWKTSADVIPLRRPLPPDGALPLKPRRPPNVNLQPFLRFKCGSSLPRQRWQDGESVYVRYSSYALVYFFSISPDNSMGFTKVANKHAIPEKYT